MRSNHLPPSPVAIVEGSVGGGGGLDGGGGFGGGQLQPALTNQLTWSNSRISGTAVIADTSDIEINACRSRFDSSARPTC